LKITSSHLDNILKECTDEELKTIVNNVFDIEEILDVTKEIIKKYPDDKD
jgi:hypothetical protein